MPGVEDRKPAISSEFDDIANRYDWLLWFDWLFYKHVRMSAERLDVGPDARILDLCCGTGVSTKALGETHPGAAITGLDFSEGMLANARKKGLPATFVHGNAQDLRAAGIVGEFDGVFMSWGIRNIPDPDRALDELFAVLKPGGTAVFHEFSLSGKRRHRWMWHGVSWGAIIPYGFVTSPGSAIWRYLWRSVVDWDDVPAFRERLSRHGFTGIEVLDVTLWQKGILHTFRARKPHDAA